ncbi:MAG: glucose-6-phosphate isomerase family protein [Planctomycetota bacterium]|jgi:glucose-6-phosphate isomerase
MQIKNTTSLIEPFSNFIDLEKIEFTDCKVHGVRNASVMRGYYKNDAALETIIEMDDPLHYETFECEIPEEYGHMIYGLSKLQPGVVDEECFMTKGHYHTITETGEVYLCLEGQGYILMKTQGGQFRAEKMTRGGLIYVPPYWAHRSVNTGNGPLTTLFIYPADAGHNYGDITEEGFPKRVFKRNGEIVIE